MPRKKTAKRSSKRQMSSSFANQQQNFIKIPAKLSMLLNQDMMGLKQKENKLKNALNKVKAQFKKAETKIKAAVKSKNKKQLKTAKKMCGKIVKMQSALKKQLEEATKSVEKMALQQSKMIALRKHISQFEKEWSKNLKKLKLKAKPTKSKTKVRGKRKSKLPMDEKSQTEPFFKTEEETILDETTELTS